MAYSNNKAHEIRTLWSKMESDRRLWEPLWRDATEFIHPRQSNSVIPRITVGQSQTDRLFDSTAIHSNTLLAASMQGSLTSSSMPWFGLRIPGLQINENHAITQYLEDCAARMHAIINQSNFNSEAHELYADLGAIGIGALFLEEKKNTRGFQGLRFTAFAPGTYCVDEDADGRVNMVMYEKKMSARAALAEFGTSVSDKVKQMASSATASPFEQVSFIHGVYPRSDFSASKYAKTKLSRDMPFASCWVELATTTLVREKGFQEFPFMVPRWSKSSGEVYGRGPGFVALPDIKTLNKAVELKLKALSKAIDPPLKQRDDGVIGDVSLVPGEITHVRDMDAVQALDLGGRFDVADMEEEKLRGAIRRIFFSDQLQLQEGPQMTAYEVQVRYELMQRILGPTLGRLETEFLDPLINRIFWIMYREKMFQETPTELRDWLDTGHALIIAYEGPLARAARLSETVATQRFFQIVLPLAEGSPDVMDLIDVDEVIRDTAINVGLKTKLLRSPEEVAAIRDAKAKLDQKKRQQEELAMGAQTAGAAAPAMKALLEAQQAGILPETGTGQGITS